MFGTDQGSKNVILYIFLNIIKRDIGQFVLYFTKGCGFVLISKLTDDYDNRNNQIGQLSKQLFLIL